jgi:hypothetical protein
MAASRLQKKMGIKRFWRGAIPNGKLADGGLKIEMSEARWSND